jgi:3-dehydroquinate dehydratase
VGNIDDSSLAKVIVENYYNSETVEQKAMVTLYNNMTKFQKKIVKIVAKCEQAHGHIS